MGDPADLNQLYAPTQRSPHLYPRIVASRARARRRRVSTAFLLVPDIAAVSAWEGLNHSQQQRLLERRGQLCTIRSNDVSARRFVSLIFSGGNPQR